MGIKSSTLDSKINEDCERHKDVYEKYCRNHDIPCCERCVRDDHKKCKDIVSLDDVVQSTNLSTYITEVQNQLTILVNNLKIIQEEKQRSSNLSASRKTVEEEIRLVRQKINDYLDQLQTKIINELCEAETNANKRTEELIKSLQEKEREMMEMEQNIVKIKQKGLDRQAFIYAKQAEAMTAKNEYYLQICQEDGSLDKILLSYYVSDCMNSFKEKITSFGKISLTTIQNIDDLKTANIKKAQIHVGLTQNINDISIKLNKEIYHCLPNVFECCTVANGTTVFGIEDKVVAFNKDERRFFELQVKERHGLASIDSSTIAVVTVKEIKYIDITKRSVVRTIDVLDILDGLIAGEAVQIHRVPGSEIQFISLKDVSVTTVVDMSKLSYITTYRNNMYYSGGAYSNTVTCFDFEGNIQWQFNKKRVLEKVRGITVDEDGNIYVVGSQSNNVVIISSDGRNHRTILTRKNGLDHPIAIHYDIKAKQILITNNNNTALLFDIS